MRAVISLLLLISAAYVTCMNVGYESLTPGRIHCQTSGFFPIPGSCREYYECYTWRNNLILHPHECMSDMYFDEVSLECKVLFHLATPPQCASNTDDLDVGESTEGNEAFNNIDEAGVSEAFSDTDDAGNNENTDSSQAFSNTDDAGVGENTDRTHAFSNTDDAGVGDTYRTHAFSNTDDAGVGKNSDSTHDFSNTADANVGENTDITQVFSNTDDSGVDNREGTRAFSNTDDTGIIDNTNGTEALGNTDDTGIIDNTNGTEALGNTDDTGVFEKTHDIEAISHADDGGVGGNYSTTTLPPPPIVSFCDHLAIVNSHATFLISPPHRESLAYQVDFNRLVERYNFILEKAQNTSRIWRNGASIFNGVKNTYQMASAYVSEFEYKYGIYQRQTMRPMNSVDLAEIQKYIQKLKVDISRSQSVLQRTTVPDLREFLLDNIASKEQELVTKEKEIQSSSKEARDLVDLLAFLDFVKKDATEVETLGEYNQVRLQELLSNFRTDQQSLQSFILRVNNSLQSLKREEESQKIELSANEETQENVDGLKSELDEELRGINAKTKANLEDMRVVNEAIKKKLDYFNKMAEIKCDANGPIKHWLKPRYTKEDFARACDEILAKFNITLDILDEKTRLKALTDQNTQCNLRVMAILKEKTNATKEIVRLTNAVPGIQTGIQQAQSELVNIQMLFNDLMDLKSSCENAINSLSEIKVAFEEVYLKFETVVKKIKLMILQGKAPEDDQARLEAKNTIEQRLSELKSDIEKLEVENIEQCTL